MKKLSEQFNKFLKSLGHAIMAILAIIASGQGTTSTLKPLKPEEQVVAASVNMLDGNAALPPDSVSSNDGNNESIQRASENLIDGLDAVAEEKRKQLDKKILEEEIESQKAENNSRNVRSIYDVSRRPTPPQNPENDD